MIIEYEGGEDRAEVGGVAHRAPVARPALLPLPAAVQRAQSAQNPRTLELFLGQDSRTGRHRHPQRHSQRRQEISQTGTFHHSSTLFI